MKKAICKSVSDWAAIYDSAPENTPCTFVDGCTGKRYQYNTKSEAVRELYNEDDKLRGRWSPGPADENNMTAWAIIEMVIDNPVHVGLPACPAWA